jgi:hypothetical protein
MSAIHAGALMEVSTGLFSDCISNSGTWNGEDYVAEVVNIVPDHLAILPDLKGACSIRDGAGLFQLNSEKGEDGLWDMLSKAVSKGIESSKLVAVLNGEIVYEVDGNHFAAPFDHDSEKSQVTVNVKNQREVLKLTGFAPLLTHKESDESPHNEETKMKKSELVDGLISNESTQFGESDREFLEGLKEDQLSKLAPVIDNEEEEEEEVEVEEEEDAEEEVIENVETVEDWISQSKCPAPIANVIRESLQNQDKTRKALVSTIVNSEHSKLTEEDLSAFSIDHLTKISESLVVENKEDETHQSYEGQQGVVANSLCLNAEEVAALGEPLGIPQMTQPKAD